MSDGWKIREFDLNSLSRLTYRIHVVTFDGKWSPGALVLEFSGTYGVGSAGNTDADFIGAIKAAALSVLHVQAVVFDFRDMHYEWGNRIWSVVRGVVEDDDGSLPTAMVVSEKCRPGFKTCATMVPPMFDSLDEALRHVEPRVHRRVAKLMGDVE